MKKYIIIIFISVSQLIMAQYHPLLVEGREWWYISPEVPGGPREPIKLEKTIEIGSKTYWDLSWFALREDEQTQSIFILSRDEQGVFSHSEMLLLKFDCIVGETFSVYCSTRFGVIELLCLVEKIEFIDGQKHITVKLQLSEPLNCENAISEFEYEYCNIISQNFGVFNETWIEGVGNPMMAGIYARYLYHNPGSGVVLPLVCERDGMSILYNNVVEGYDCEDIGTDIDELKAEELLTINNDILMLKDVMCGSAAIYSADGQLVLSFTGNTADISSLPHGLYIVRAGTKTAKFVK